MSAGENSSRDSSTRRRKTSVYLKFGLSLLTKPVKSATLRVYKLGATGGVTVSAKSVNSDSWTQKTAGGSLPAMGTTLKSVSAAKTGGYVEFDVTSAVQSKAAGSKLFSVALQTAAPGYTWFVSREGMQKPQLVIKY